jgi:mitogen-activated protein kinase kinase kinase 2
MYAGPAAAECSAAAPNTQPAIGGASGMTAAWIANKSTIYYAFFAHELKRFDVQPLFNSFPSSRASVNGGRRSGPDDDNVVAGVVTPSNSHVDGVGTAARFVGMKAMTGTRNGTVLYVIDTSALRKVDLRAGGNSVVSTISLGAPLEVSPTTPTYVSLTRGEGSLLVSQTVMHCVREINLVTGGGVVVAGTCGATGSSLSFPAAVLELPKNGKRFVADRLGVIEVRSDTSMTRVANSSFPILVMAPFQDDANKIQQVVLLSGTCGVSYVDRVGETTAPAFASVPAACLWIPMAIAVDDDGNYVTMTNHATAPVWQVFNCSRASALQASMTTTTTTPTTAADPNTSAAPSNTTAVPRNKFGTTTPTPTDAQDNSATAAAAQAGPTDAASDNTLVIAVAIVIGIIVCMCAAFAITVVIVRSRRKIRAEAPAATTAAATASQQNTPRAPSREHSFTRSLQGAEVLPGRHEHDEDKPQLPPQRADADRRDMQVRTSESIEMDSLPRGTVPSQDGVNGGEQQQAVNDASVVIEIYDDVPLSATESLPTAHTAASSVFAEPTDQRVRSAADDDTLPAADDDTLPAADDDTKHRHVRVCSEGGVRRSIVMDIAGLPGATIHAERPETISRDNVAASIRAAKIHIAEQHTMVATLQENLAGAKDEVAALAAAEEPRTLEVQRLGRDVADRDEQVTILTDSVNAGHEREQGLRYDVTEAKAHAKHLQAEAEHWRQQLEQEQRGIPTDVEAQLQNKAEDADVIVGEAATPPPPGTLSPSLQTARSRTTNDNDDSSVVLARMSPADALHLGERQHSGAAELTASQRHDIRCTAVSAGSYQKGKVIGRGATATVYSVMLDDGSTIAMKEMNLVGSEEEVAQQSSDVEQEIAMLSKLRHPNVVVYYGVVFDTDKMVAKLFMELVQGGSLASMVKSLEGRMREGLVKKFMRQIVEGLAVMHGKGFLHRDLKADNVLIDTSNGSVKLSDFGTAKNVGTASQGRTVSVAKTMIGTPLYMAPEVIAPAMSDEEMPEDEIGYGKKADIWSLGIMTSELLDQGKMPWPTFNTPAHAFRHINSEQGVPITPEGVSPEAAAFVQRCCVRNPTARPTASELLRDEFLADAATPQPQGAAPFTPKGKHGNTPLATTQQPLATA